MDEKFAQNVGIAPLVFHIPPIKGCWIMLNQTFWQY